MDDDAGIGRRLSAARRAAGIDTREELTAAVELPNLGPGTLGRIERGERHLFPHEAEAFARVLGVDVAYFYNAPSSDAPLEDRLDRIEQAIAGLAEALTQASDTAIVEREAIMGLLAQQEAILTELSRVVGGLPDDDALKMWNEGSQDVLAAAEALRAARSASEAAQAGTPRRRAASE